MEAAQTWGRPSRRFLLSVLYESITYLCVVSISLRTRLLLRTGTHEMTWNSFDFSKK